MNKIRKSNSDVGGKIFEVGSTEYYVRGRGYIKSVEDIENIPLKIGERHSRLREERRHRPSRAGHPPRRG